MKKIVVKIVSLALAVVMVIPFFTACADDTDVIYFYRSYGSSSNITINGINSQGKVIGGPNTYFGTDSVSVMQYFYVKSSNNKIKKDAKCYCDISITVATIGGTEWLFTDSVYLGKVTKNSSGKLVLPCASIDKVIEGKMYRNPKFDNKTYTFLNKGKKTNTTCQFYYDKNKKAHLDFFYDNSGERIAGTVVSAAVATGLIVASFYAMDYYAAQEAWNELGPGVMHEFQWLFEGEGMNAIAVGAACAFGNNNVKKRKANSSDTLFDINCTSSGAAKLNFGYHDFCGKVDENTYLYLNKSLSF